MEYQKLLLGENPYFVSCVQASYPVHCHNEIELMYCTKGNFRVIIENKEYRLREGSLLFISSLAMHQVITDGDSTALVLEFGSAFLGAGSEELMLKRFAHPLIDAGELCEYRQYLEAPLKNLYTEYTKREAGYTWAIQGYLFEIFAAIVRHVPMEHDEKKRKNLGGYLKIQKAFELIHENYAQRITVESAAAHVGYDPRAFCRLFKSITNETFHEHLNFYRINIAMHLLQYKSYPIGEIGQMVGIPVAKTFSRLFREHTGMTPREYRRTYASETE